VKEYNLIYKNKPALKKRGFIKIIRLLPRIFDVRLRCCAGAILALRLVSARLAKRLRFRRAFFL